MIPPDVAARYRREGWWKPETLTQRFDNVCASEGDRVAIIDGAHRVTFAEAASLVERLAGRFIEMGVEPGDVVSWQLPGWWEAAIVHHAILRAGAIPNPLNPILRARELRFILHEAQPKILITPATLRDFDHAALAHELKQEIATIDQTITVRGNSHADTNIAKLLESRGSSPEPPKPIAENTALLLYTSGTTSDPKGVLHSHETLMYEVASLQDIHELTTDDRYLGGSPVAHIAGLVYGLLMPFVLGTSTALMERWDPRAALELIERDRVTFQTGAPAFLLQLADAYANEDVSSFRLFSTGGASITTATVAAAAARLGCVVKRAYGSTEVPTLTATRFDDSPDVRAGTDGRVIEPAEMRLTSEGEILARSPEVFLGYRNPALNDCFDDEGWYHTGDLGVVDGDGNLRVTGRIKDIIIRGGENISAKEIEDLLHEHPAVAEATVIGLPDPMMGERACAVVVLRSPLSFDEMSAYLLSRDIAKQKLPERMEVRDQLPRTASGKVLKTALRAEFGG